MFNQTKFNRTVILYFVTVILGLAFSALTSCGDTSAYSPAFSTPIIQQDGVEVTQTQCTGITKAGVQCSRKAADGETKCWQHGGATKTEQAGTKIQASGTCGAATKAGTACKNRTKDGGKCHLHRG